MAWGKTLKMVPLVVTISLVFPIISFANDKLTFVLPIVGEIEIPEQYGLIVLVAVGLVFILYYIPRGFVTIRDSFRQLRSHRTSLEMEKLKYEILKLRYEIEGPKKNHDIPEIALDENLQSSIDALVRIPSNESFRKRELERESVLKQVEDIEKRKRFVLRRIAANMIDLIIVSVAFNIPLLLLNRTPSDMGQSVIYFYFYPGLFLYVLIMWTFWGASFGKMLLRLKITGTDGGHITFKAVIIRLFFALLTCVPILGVGFFWVLWDKKKQALYDRIARTFVVGIRREQEV